MAKQAAVKSVTSQPQPTASTASLKATRVDGNTDCATLMTEIAKTDAIILASSETITGAGGANFAGQAAAAAGSQVALQNGAAGALAKVPFGGLFAKAAVDKVANSGKRKTQKAQADLQSANLRKAKLSGLYAGKNCAP